METANAKVYILKDEDLDRKSGLSYVNHLAMLLPNFMVNLHKMLFDQTPSSQ
jgi:hypothetical protein